MATATERGGSHNGRAKLKPRERIEVGIARAMTMLPPRAQIKLSRKAPVQLDGLTLEPDIQLMLALLERQGLAPLESYPPPVAREIVLKQSQMFAGPEIVVGEVNEIEVDGAEGRLKARHYAPVEPGGPHPLIIYYHGGGFVICDLDTHDATCRTLCRHAGAHVLSVDYRLAPEHRFPAAVDDCRAALRWACQHTGELGADPDRIAVAGDSAGGNLATVVSQLARDDGGPTPNLQILIYPVTDFSTDRPSRELFAEGFFLTQSEMDWFHENYSADMDATDPRLSPIVADDLSGMPPAYICTAGFDPLRDEGEEYADKLRAAGNKVVLRRFPGLIHGFANMTSQSRASRDALVEVAGAARAMLATL